MNLENKTLKLNFSEKFAYYELQSKVFPEVSFRSSFEVTCFCEGNSYQLIEDVCSISQIKQIEKMETRFGSLELIDISIDTTLPDVGLNIRVGLAKDDPTAFVQIELTNKGSEPIYIDKIMPLIIKAGALSLGSPGFKNPAFYSNGWQSWSTTGTFKPGDKQHTSIIGKFQNPQIYNPGTPHHRDGKHFSGDMFGVLCDNDTRVGLLAGFISQKEHFGSLEASLETDPALKMWANGDHTRLDPGKTIKTDWASLSFIALDDPNPLDVYFDQVAKEHHIQSTTSVPVGWCSWYHFYQDISEEVIEANRQSILEIKDRVPLKLLQIDDGFETYPGDWFDFVPGFPDGVKPLAEKAVESGLSPGLWLAPFIIHPRAKLVKEHPEWLLRDAQGKLVSAGFVWNTFCYGLDLTNPQALDYACEVIRKAVEDWGFKYLKLDFLYAAALECRYQDPTRTRAQVLRLGLEALRDAAGPDIVMLACGCPLGSALGVFEAMRIGADVSGHWEPRFPPFSKILKNEPNMPSARNALQNIITRAPLHRQWWINDPDCLLVRPETELTIPEVQTLATAIGLTGGSLLLSDDLPALPHERLKIAQALLPVIDQRAQVLDLFENHTPALLRLDLENETGHWYLLAIFNWEDNPISLSFSPQKFHLPENQVYWCREFWQGQIGQMSDDSSFILHDVPPHGVRLISARRYDADQPAYLGGDVHLSQGLEINRWEVGDRRVSLGFDLGRRAGGKLYFYLPWHPMGLWEKERPYMMMDEGKGIYSVAVDEVDGMEFEIRG
jgi:alpha-galactosidase